MPVLPPILSDHPSLVGIIRFPLCSATTVKTSLPIITKNESGQFMSATQVVDMATDIEHITIDDSPFTVNKNKVTDFYPYTYYVLTDGECEPLILEPQYMKTQSSIKGRFALSHQPLERYYVEGYKGDNDGRIYNITNLNQMMLPTATNEGIGYLSANANTIAQTRKNTITSNVLTGVSAVGSLLSGSVGGAMIGASSLINGLMNIKSIDARNRDLALTPSSISSYGTPSSREAFGNNEVRVLKYTVKDNVKNKVENFVKRYGNKYNNYDTIDIKQYKGYIKFVDVKINSKIDNIHLNKIIEILERGVYIE